ncbi:MAG: hypothetical protein CVV42_10735 [Candidatus Riflebacteria bacterium HGW-Riflebacteria-2]|jgi:hypothetical protein|nr:MAG: hypothetical protein CVV42_10735 [Candidatus Riflebacteria bacterium HGW-Riflebacteria-2]
MKKRFVTAAFVAALLPTGVGASTERLENYYYYLKQTASEALQFDRDTAKDWYESLPDLKLKENFENSVDKLKEMLSQPPETSADKNQQSNRVLIESFGRTRIGKDGKTLNEYAQDAIDRVRPDLRDTDYFNDPARTLTYFVLFDPKGFIENVRIIRGPLDSPMTLKEAYQYYKRTDPAKAQKILNMLDRLQRLYGPNHNPDEKQLDIIIEAIQQTVDLLNNSDR